MGRTLEYRKVYDKCAGKGRQFRGRPHRPRGASAAATFPNPREEPLCSTVCCSSDSVTVVEPLICGRRACPGRAQESTGHSSDGCRRRRGCERALTRSTTGSWRVARSQAPSPKSASQASASQRKIRGRLSSKRPLEDVEGSLRPSVRIATCKTTCVTTSWVRSCIRRSASCCSRCRTQSFLASRAQPASMTGWPNSAPTTRSG